MSARTAGSPLLFQGVHRPNHPYGSAPAFSVNVENINVADAQLELLDLQSYKDLNDALQEKSLLYFTPDSYKISIQCC